MFVVLSTVSETPNGYETVLLYPFHFLNIRNIRRVGVFEGHAQVSRGEQKRMPGWVEISREPTYSGKPIGVSWRQPPNIFGSLRLPRGAVSERLI